MTEPHFPTSANSRQRSDYGYLPLTDQAAALLPQGLGPPQQMAEPRKYPEPSSQLQSAFPLFPSKNLSSAAPLPPPSIPISTGPAVISPTPTNTASNTSKLPLYDLFGSQAKSVGSDVVGRPAGGYLGVVGVVPTFGALSGGPKSSSSSSLPSAASSSSIPSWEYGINTKTPPVAIASSSVGSTPAGLPTSVPITNLKTASGPLSSQPPDFSVKAPASSGWVGQNPMAPFAPLPAAPAAHTSGSNLSTALAEVKSPNPPMALQVVESGGGKSTNRAPRLMVRDLMPLDRSAMPECLKSVLPPAPKAVPQHMFDCIMCILISKPSLRSSFGLGWEALSHMWGISKTDFDTPSMTTLQAKDVKLQEGILLLMASLDLRDIANLSAFLITLIKQYERRSQICMHFLLGLCDDPPQKCSCVHPANTPGWDLLRDKWKITFMDLDYAVLSNLAKRGVIEREAALKMLAGMSLKSVSNLSAFASCALRKYDASAAANNTTKTKPEM